MSTAATSRLTLEPVSGRLPLGSPSAALAPAAAASVTAHEFPHHGAGLVFGVLAAVRHRAADVVPEPAGPGRITTAAAGRPGAVLAGPGAFPGERLTAAPAPRGRVLATVPSTVRPPGPAS